MLSRYVSLARAAEAPWDDARAARVLEHAVAVRRSSQSKRPVGWMLTLAGASLLTAFLAKRPLSSTGDAAGAGSSGNSRPAAASEKSDALDGGKQTG